MKNFFSTLPLIKCHFKSLVFVVVTMVMKCNIKLFRHHP